MYCTTGQHFLYLASYLAVYIVCFYLTHGTWCLFLASVKEERFGIGFIQIMLFDRRLQQGCGAKNRRKCQPWPCGTQTWLNWNVLHRKQELERIFIRGMGHERRYNWSNVCTTQYTHIQLQVQTNGIIWFVCSHFHFVTKCSSVEYIMFHLWLRVQ